MCDGSPSPVAREVLDCRGNRERSVLLRCRSGDEASHARVTPVWPCIACRSSGARPHRSGALREQHSSARRPRLPRHPSFKSVRWRCRFRAPASSADVLVPEPRRSRCRSSLVISRSHLMSSVLNHSPVPAAPKTVSSHSAVNPAIWPWAHSMIAGSGVAFVPDPHRADAPACGATSISNPATRYHRMGR